MYFFKKLQNLIFLIIKSTIWADFKNRRALLTSAGILCLCSAGVGANWLYYHYEQQKVKDISAFCRRATDFPNDALWFKVGVLNAISLYPLKSAGGLAIKQTQCDKFGIHYEGLRDRLLILLDKQGNVIDLSAQRNILTIQPSVLAHRVLSFKSPMQKHALILHLNELVTAGATKNCIYKSINNCVMRLVECEKEHHKWFSQALLQETTGLRLYIALEVFNNQTSWEKRKDNFLPITIMYEDILDAIHDYMIRHSLQNIRSSNVYKTTRSNFLIKTHIKLKAQPAPQWNWIKIGSDEGNCTILNKLNMFAYRNDFVFVPHSKIVWNALGSGAGKHGLMFNHGIYYAVHKEGTVRIGDSVCVQ